jgi:zinc/manganese transport system substrate-binding protein
MLKTLRLATLMSVITFTPLGLVDAKAEGLDVVASFSIIGDFAKNVGGDRVTVTTLVGPDGDAHVYEPSPADATAMVKADVVLVNGLHFEGFLQRLVEASATKATVVELTKGVTPLKMEEEGHEHGEEGHEAGHAEESHEAGHAEEEGHGHGDIDPHAFQSIANAKIYVANIVVAFCAADASGCDTYKANGASYTDKLDAVEKEVKQAIAAIPAARSSPRTTPSATSRTNTAWPSTRPRGSRPRPSRRLPTSPS